MLTFLASRSDGGGAIEERDWKAILPEWAGPFVGVEFPAEALAAYASYKWKDEMAGRNQQEAKVLVVTPRALMAFELQAQIRDFPGDTKGRISAVAIPISSVRTVRWELRFQVPRGRAARVMPEDVVIDLDRELGDWGSTLTLPADPDDYGSSGDSQQAAAAFGRAVVSALVSSRASSNTPEGGLAAGEGHS